MFRFYDITKGLQSLFENNPFQFIFRSQRQIQSVISLFPISICQHKKKNLHSIQPAAFYSATVTSTCVQSLLALSQQIARFRVCQP